MQYKEFKPSKSLEPYVKCYYILECKQGTFIEDQAFATGCIEAMFTLEGAQWQTKKDGVFTKTSPVELWGQIVKPLSFQVSGFSKIVGIRFYPSAAAFLLKSNVNLFNNGVFELSSIVGNSILDLQGQLQEAQSVNKQIDLIENFLVRRLSSNPKTIEKIVLLKDVMSELVKEDFFDNISNVASRYGMSSRYLQKVFFSLTGLTPKLYTKINRFQNSLVLLDRKDLSLTDVAYECGYFDQSHFIREFKTFTGSIPSRFTTANSTAILASPNK